MTMREHQAHEMARILDQHLNLCQPYFDAAVDACNQDEIEKLSYVYRSAMRLRIQPERYVQIACDTLKYQTRTDHLRILRMLASPKTIHRVKTAMPQYNKATLALPKKHAYVGNASRRVPMRKDLWRVFGSLRIVRDIMRNVGNNDAALVACMTMLRTELHPGVLYSCAPIASTWHEYPDMPVSSSAARECVGIVDYVAQKFSHMLDVRKTIERLRSIKQAEGDIDGTTISTTNQPSTSTRDSF